MADQKSAKRPAGVAAGAGEDGRASLDALSTVPVAGTLFLELQGRHPPGSLDDLKLRFSRRVIFLARRWRNRLNDELRSSGHSHARWIALIWIHLLDGTANHRELAERIGVELPTLIRLLNRLEAEKLVEREAMGPNRAKAVRITPRGRQVLEELNAIAEQARARFLEGVDEEKLQTAMSLFDDLIAREEGPG